MVNMRSLATNIKVAILTNSVLIKCLEYEETSDNSHWSVEENEILLYNRCTFVPESNNLHL